MKVYANVAIETNNHFVESLTYDGNIKLYANNAVIANVFNELDLVVPATLRIHANGMIHTSKLIEI